jgi:hypothetical protein
VTVTWHPDAVRRAINHAKAITSAAQDPDAVYQLPGGRLSWMDLSALADASRAALGDDEAVDWERVAVKLALADGADFLRLTTKEAEALRPLVDAERQRETAAGGDVQ